MRLVQYHVSNNIVRDVKEIEKCIDRGEYVLIVSHGELSEGWKAYVKCKIKHSENIGYYNLDRNKEDKARVAYARYLMQFESVEQRGQK